MRTLNVIRVQLLLGITILFRPEFNELQRGHLDSPVNKKMLLAHSSILHATTEVRTVCEWLYDRAPEGQRAPHAPALSIPVPPPPVLPAFCCDAFSKSPKVT